MLKDFPCCRLMFCLLFLGRSLNLQSFFDACIHATYKMFIQARLGCGISTRVFDQRYHITVKRELSPPMCFGTQLLDTHILLKMKKKEQKPLNSVENRNGWNFDLLVKNICVCTCDLMIY